MGGLRANFVQMQREISTQTTSPGTKGNNASMAEGRSGNLLNSNQQVVIQTAYMKHKIHYTDSSY